MAPAPRSTHILEGSNGELRALTTGASMAKRSGAGLTAVWTSAELHALPVRAPMRRRVVGRSVGKPSAVIALAGLPQLMGTR